MAAHELGIFCSRYAKWDRLLPHGAFVVDHIRSCKVPCCVSQTYMHYMQHTAWAYDLESDIVVHMKSLPL
jgi:hypothetical protein